MLQLKNFIKNKNVILFLKELVQYFKSLKRTRSKLQCIKKCYSKNHNTQNSYFEYLIYYNNNDFVSLYQGFLNFFLL